MDLAFCVLDNMTYTSAQFSKLNFADMSEKRRSLACPECKGSAFFRKKTRNGRAACFGARPHQPNCSISALDETKVLEGYGEIVEFINNPGERIVVDLNFGAHIHVHAEPNAGAARGSARAGAYTGGGNPNNARMHRRLSTLLRTLIESPHFRQSDQTLEILGIEIMVRDFFVPLLDIKPHHLNSMKGYWGMLSDVAVGQSGTVWLNSGGRDDISFCLDEKQFSDISARFRITDPEEYSGAYILVIGEVKLSQNNKKYCNIQDQKMICLRLT